MAEAKLMQAEVISIGDELTSGQRLDTNSQWLSLRLAELGIGTLRHTTVGDDLAANIEALQQAAGRAEWVVCTGGLGPTLDDLTRTALAEAFGAPLELDPQSLARIELMFAQRKREMPERNRLQAMFPRGSRVVPNPHGTAPGIDMTVAGERRTSRIFALPGVPAEMRQMWYDTVVPRIEESQGESNGRLWQHAVRLFGIGESDVETRLPNLIDRGRRPTVGITVSRATITLRIAARAHSQDQFAKLIGPTLTEIEAALGDLIFGQGEDELEHAVLRQLAQHGLRMASVEIGAANWVSDWMLQAAGPEPHDALRGGYVGGIAFPSLERAQRWFSGSEIGAAGVWEAIAQQARHRFGADVVLLIGPYPTLAEMESSTAAFPFNYVIVVGEQVRLEQRNMGGHPDVLGPRVAKTGLDLVRRKLASINPPGELP